MAERAGVSIASVSRVLNGLPASESIAERVRAAAAELGYVPNSTARSLKVGRTEQIALAVADVGNPVYVSMMHAVNEVVASAGFRLVLSSTGSDPVDQIDLLKNLNRGFADGLILSPLRVTPDLIEELRASRLPLVIIGSLPEGVAVDNVRANSRKGVGLAVQHLHENGRRQIGFLNGPVDTVPGTARLAGYLRAMAKLSLPITSDLQVEADDFTYEAGLVATTALLNQSSPDAIVCANDLLAVAAMKIIVGRGLRVPQDIALVGMDNTSIAELANPALTSVDLGSTKRARKAAKLLLARIADPSLPVHSVVVAPALVIRESSIVPA
ncbi:LacI family DNA-binding transcriptional regulator [Cryobacterium sp. Hh11]|uniref:LacI family DNA-binding transcriptional regulator n=1 Tax=Cryobacterium sp. Hh11 TaxID=2555868 RepID=UPI001F53EBD6|nr:LacI family DNA-binding transcriptional regulator [Cryobacterium sp. Hh11]